MNAQRRGVIRFEKVLRHVLVDRPPGAGGTSLLRRAAVSLAPKADPTAGRARSRSCDVGPLQPSSVSPHAGQVGATTERRRVLITDSVDVGITLERAMGGLGPRDAPRLSALASSAESGVQQIRVGPFGPDHLSRDVQVTVHGFMRRGPAWVAWLEWSAPGDGLVPVLDAELELAPLASDACRIRLSGSYLPPLGVVGRGLDWAVMHRVAQLTIRNFLDRLGEVLAASPEFVESGRSARS